jgi:hypothetical protein
MVSHLEPERLVLLALSEEPADATEAAHVGSCPACESELSVLRGVAVLGRETQEVRDLPDPPDRVWEGIAAATGVPVVPDAPTALGPVAGGPAAGRSSGVGALPRGKAAREELAARRERRERRRGGWGRMLVTAVAAATVAVAGTVGVQQFRERNRVEVTAQAALTPLTPAPTDAQGQARILLQRDGRVLHLHVTAVPRGPGYYQVWLINPADFADMISVGTLGDNADELLRLPPTVDLRKYRVVDISEEQYDGKVEHSGKSLLRGTLTG